MARRQPRVLAEQVVAQPAVGIRGIAVDLQQRVIGSPAMSRRIAAFRERVSARPGDRLQLAPHGHLFDVGSGLRLD